MYFSLKIKENQYKKNQNPFIITFTTLLLLLFNKILKKDSFNHFAVTFYISHESIKIHLLGT